MTYIKSPRVVTDEQFSDGTTIDGNRLDRAVQDVQDRINSVPYGDLKSRWVPITYMCGWQPQSRKTIFYDTSASLGTGFVTPSQFQSGEGKIPEIHRFPWMRLSNDSSQVPQGESGASVGDNIVFTNPWRVKGSLPQGIYARHDVHTLALSDTQGIFNSMARVGEQWCWTRSWFFDTPTILDSVDLILLLDHPTISSPARAFDNSLKYDVAATNETKKFLPGLPTGDLEDRGLVISATVDSVFDPENQLASSVEVLRRDFRLSDDHIISLATPDAAGTGGQSTSYQDMKPFAGQSNSGSYGVTGGGTLFGLHIKLNDLNVPIHKNARLRVHTILPRYVIPSNNPTDSTYTYMENFTVNQLEVNGWGDYPWFMQQVNMTVTMLEEVVGV